MCGWISVEEHPAVKVWTRFLWEWGINYKEQALLALLTWAKNCGLDTTKEAVLDINTWVRKGRLIIKAASKGNKSAEMHGKEWVPDEAAGGVGIPPRAWRKPLDEMATLRHCGVLNRHPAPVLCPAEPDHATLPHSRAPAGGRERGGWPNCGRRWCAGLRNPAVWRGPGGQRSWGERPNHGEWKSPAMRRSPSWRCAELRNLVTWQGPRKRRSPGGWRSSTEQLNLSRLWRYSCARLPCGCLEMLCHAKLHHHVGKAPGGCTTVPHDPWDSHPTTRIVCACAVT